MAERPCFADYGLSQLSVDGQMLSPVYWHPVLYRWVMKRALGNQREVLFRKVSDRIRPAEKVLDLCCGDCYLSQFVETSRYSGMDGNVRFVKWARGRRLDVSLVDLRTAPLPRRDVLVMTASFYYFMDDAQRMIERMQQAAKRSVLILEPVEGSWANSRSKVAQLIGAWLSDVGRGPVRERFSRASLERCLAENGFSQFEMIDGHLLAEWQRSSTLQSSEER